LAKVRIEKRPGKTVTDQKFTQEKTINPRWLGEKKTDGVRCRWGAPYGNSGSRRET